LHILGQPNTVLAAADNWDFEKGHTAAVGGFPPKYAVNLADAEYDQNPHTYGSPGGISQGRHCHSTLSLAVIGCHC
jgi:hypothetical protein